MSADGGSSRTRDHAHSPGRAWARGVGLTRCAGLALACLVALGGCAGGGYARPKMRPLAAGLTFAGSWDSTWGKMQLTQEGDHVYGTFNGYREGAVSGHAEGDVFRFVWDQRVPRSHGRGFMQLTPDGQHLEGRWGYLKEDADGGRWAADRD